jgi:exosortase/archaeosortase family protein
MGSMHMLEDAIRMGSIAGAGAQFSRRELFVWLASILCASAFAQSMTHGGTTALSLESIGAFQLLGWFAVLRLLYLQTSSAPASSRDFWVAGLVGAINLLPSGKATWIAASLAALYIYAGNEKGSNGRAGAAVLGALSVQSLWGPTLFSLFTVYILRADATLVGVALKLTRGGFDWHENVISTQGFTVGIYNDCSSFHNISLAALCWISLTKLHRPTFIRSDFKFGAAACLAMIALNAARLYTISLGRESFAYWHDGAGAQIFAVTASFIIAAICAWGASIDGAKHE